MTTGRGRLRTRSRSSEMGADDVVCWRPVRHDGRSGGAFSSFRSNGGLRHAGALALFACLTLAWTWPLLARLHDALPGNPGDNYSFVWNLWWMRLVLVTPGLGYFHTDYLFYPFGTTIADHPNTALPAFIGATVLSSASPATAQNLLLLAYVFANLAAMYALAWSVTRRHLSSILAALIFGISPYVAVHLLGHFDLVAAWPLPLYALFLASRDNGSLAPERSGRGTPVGRDGLHRLLLRRVHGCVDGRSPCCRIASAHDRVAETRACVRRPGSPDRSRRAGVCIRDRGGCHRHVGGGSLALGRFRISARTLRTR